MPQYSDALNAALKEAMKNKDTDRRNTIRLLTSAFKQVQIDEQRDLTEADELNILEKEAKKRRETIDELSKAGRDTSQEEYELGIITEFLPAQMSREEIEALAKEIIAEVGAESQKDMGKVMGQMAPKTKGRADGKLVSTVVRELLSQS